jgi:hypothetical protein
MINALQIQQKKNNARAKAKAMSSRHFATTNSAATPQNLSLCAWFSLPKSTHWFFMMYQINT